MKHFASLLLPAALAINLTAGSMIAVAARPRTPSPAAKPSPALSASYAKIPMSFESNQGQADASVQFLSRGPGYRLALEPGGASFALHPAVKPGTPEVGNPAPATQLSLRLVGANAHAVAAHEDQQMTRTNYLIGNDPTRWHTNVPNYGRVRYSSVYPGIDLVYYGNQHQLEHDFVVAPQADPAQIALAFDIEGGAKLSASTLRPETSFSQPAAKRICVCLPQSPTRTSRAAGPRSRPATSCWRIIASVLRSAHIIMPGR